MEAKDVAAIVIASVTLTILFIDLMITLITHIRERK